MNEFIKKYNDYRCVYSDNVDNIGALNHYTAFIDAVKNIVNGCFWATDIFDFSDKKEGKLIFFRIIEILEEMDILNDEYKEVIRELIGDENRVEKFLSCKDVNVLSFSKNVDSQYLWKYYAGENGYRIIFDSEKLLNSIHFFTANNQKKKSSYVKFAKIIYGKDEQRVIIESELKGLVSVLDYNFTVKDNMEMLLEHLAYIGNYFKRHSSYDDVGFENEEEFRVLVNTIKESERYHDVEELLPIHKERADGRHYIELFFDPKAIVGIECGSEFAKTELESVLPQVKIFMKQK